MRVQSVPNHPHYFCIFLSEKVVESVFRSWQILSLTCIIQQRIRRNVTFIIYCPITLIMHQIITLIVHLKDFNLQLIGIVRPKHFRI